MNACPTCGTENPRGVRLCQSCGTRLAPTGTTAPPAAPRTGEGRGQPDDVVGRLRAMMPASVPEEPPPDDTEEVPDWLAELARRGDEVETPDLLGTRLGESTAPPPPEDDESNIPTWLQGAVVESSPSEEFNWGSDIDFSDLPGWLQPEDQPSRPEPRSAVPDWVQARTGEGPLATSLEVESEGSGLLAGIPGPIPVEPVIALPHEAPPFPGEDIPDTPPTAADEEAIALFSAIATGIRPAPAIPTEQVRRRALPLLSLLLIVAVLAPLVLRTTLSSPSVGARSPLLMVSTIEALPPESYVLVAFNYEGGRIDELEPGALMLLRHLQAKQARILAISTSPLGPELAQHAWERLAPANRPGGAGYGERFVNLGYLPGSEAGLRSLLVASLTPGLLGTDRDVVLGQPLTELPATRDLRGVEDLRLVVVIAAESNEVQRWIEQVGSAYPGLPIVVVVPAAAEPILQPYVDSGQVRAVLGGVLATAGYELLLSGGDVAARRLDAMTAGILVFVAVIVAGNLVALWQRLRRQE